MPFSGYDLVKTVNQVRKDYLEASAYGSSRLLSVFAPKGGVGKTTVAFNLACALGQLEQKTVLIDGSLQFGDLRSLLRSEEHTSELQSRQYLVCRLLLEKKK